MRWDNALYPDWFQFPDLAILPDHANEPRHTGEYDLSVLHKAISTRDITAFMNEVKKFTGDADWLGKLGKSFKHVCNYKARSIRFASNKCWHDLYEYGLHITDIDFSGLNVAPIIANQLAREDWNPPPGSYDRGSFLDNKAISLIQQRFQDHGIIDAVNGYSGKSRRVTGAYLHISTPTDKHYKQFLRDAKTTPRWTNLHIDPKEDVMKAIIYMEPVAIENGPFGYVPTSNRFMHPPLQEIFGRAITTGNYCMTPDARRSVFALPKPLRVSYNFGRCVLDDSQLSRDLAKCFHPVTSDQGNVMIFDAGAGMHQGGLVKKGRRISIQVLMK